MLRHALVILCGLCRAHCTLRQAHCTLQRAHCTLQYPTTSTLYPTTGAKPSRGAGRGQGWQERPIYLPVFLRTILVSLGPTKGHHAELDRALGPTKGHHEELDRALGPTRGEQIHNMEPGACTVDMCLQSAVLMGGSAEGLQELSQYSRDPREYQ